MCILVPRLRFCNNLRVFLGSSDPMESLYDEENSEKANIIREQGEEEEEEEEGELRGEDTGA